MIAPTCKIGLVCLDVSGYRRKRSISRRAKAHLRDGPEREGWCAWMLADAVPRNPHPGGAKAYLTWGDWM